MKIVITDADIVIKVFRAGFWDDLLKFKKQVHWQVLMPTFIMEEIKKTSTDCFDSVKDSIRKGEIEEINPAITQDHVISKRWIEYNKIIDRGEAIVCAIAESLSTEKRKCIVLSDNRSDFKLLHKRYKLHFNWYSLYELCYGMFKENVITEEQIDMGLQKLVSSGDLRMNDSVFKKGFAFFIKSYKNRNFKVE